MRHGRVCIVAIVLLVCALVPLKSREPPADSDVPFDLVQQHFIVAKGSIAGMHDLGLLIDTGTIPSMVDQRIAKKLGLRAQPSKLVAFGQTIDVNAAVLAGLHVGPLEPGEVPVFIGDLSYLRGALRYDIDGIVGLDILIRRSFGIDYKAHTLSFGPSERESAVAPMKVVWPFLTVELVVAGQSMQLLVDTGSRELVLFKSHMSPALMPVPWRGEVVIRHAAGLTSMQRYELHQVTLGDQHWDTLSGFVLDASTKEYPPGIDGVLGVMSLGGKRVRFDLERHELGWSP
jgi:predicted aspartyl protease